MNNSGIKNNRDMIEYITTIQVRLDGKPVGTIKPMQGGYAYFPNEGTRGDIYHTISEVKQTLI